MELFKPYLNVEALGGNNFVLRMIIKLPNGYKPVEKKHSYFKFAVNNFSGHPNLEKLSLKFVVYKTAEITGDKTYYLDFPFQGVHRHDVETVVEIIEVKCKEYLLHCEGFNPFFRYPDPFTIADENRLNAELNSIEDENERKLVLDNVNALKKIVKDYHDLKVKVNTIPAMPPLVKKGLPKPVKEKVSSRNVLVNGEGGQGEPITNYEDNMLKDALSQSADQKNIDPSHYEVSCNLKYSTGTLYRSVDPDRCRP